jgi:peptidoglycan/xylan/chitin deacetylase (PgdA/CDA1 family)
MVHDQHYTTRRKFLTTSALAFGVSSSTAISVGSQPTNAATSSGATQGSEPTDTPKPTSTDELADRTRWYPAMVNPPYQGDYIRSGRTVENVEDLSNWNGREESDLVPDTATKFSGTQSMKFEGAGRSVIHGDYEDNPVDLSDSDISLAVNFHEPTDATPAFYLTAHAPDPDNAIQFKTYYDASKDINWERLDLAPTSVVGNPDLSDVRSLLFTVVASSGQSVSVNIDDIRAHPKPEKAKLIFRFDDTHTTHYEDYFPVLQEHGYPGIEAVVRSKVGSTLSVDQLLELQDAGWDLCNHMTRHQNITNLSNRKLQEDIDEMDSWFANHDMNPGLELHILTYGDYNGRTLEVLSENFDVVFGGGGPTNYDQTSPMVVGSYNAENGIKGTKEMINDAAKHRSLLVLMFHNKYSRSEFKEIVGYVAAREDKIDVINGSNLQEHLAELT